MPKIVDKDKKRSEIAHAAISLFANKGFDSTTIQEIADAAQIGKGTVYEYFDTKEEIIIQVAMEMFAEMEKSIDLTIFAIKDPKERLKKFIEQTNSLVEHMKDIMMVYMEIWRINLRDKNFGVSMMILKDALVTYRKVISDIIKEGQKMHVFKKSINGERLAIMLTAAFDGLAFHYLLDNKNIDLKKVSGEFINSLFEGIVISE